MGQAEPKVPSQSAAPEQRAGGKTGAQDGGLAHLRKATDTLSGLLAQQVKDLNASQRAARRAGQDDRAAALKGLKEATAVLKDLAAVAKTLNEQGEAVSEAACGVVLLPPVETEADEP